MFTAKHYKSQAAEALERAQKSRVRSVRRGHIKLHLYWEGLAAMAAKRESASPVDAFAQRVHHETVRKYRRELATAPEGLGRNKLNTLLARMKMAAKEQGWPETT